MMESDSLEVLVNFGSIDNVSHAPCLAAPFNAVRSRTLCLACKPLRLCCDHLTCTRDRFSCFRRPAYVRMASFSLWKRRCSGMRPAASSSSSSAAAISICRRRCLFMQRDVIFDCSVVRSLLMTLHGALCGFLVKHADTRLSMSLRSCGTSAVTDVVGIGTHAHCSMNDILCHALSTHALQMGVVQERASDSHALKTMYCY